MSYTIFGSKRLHLYPASDIITPKKQPIKFQGLLKLSIQIAVQFIDELKHIFSLRSDWCGSAFVTNRLLDQ